MLANMWCTEVVAGRGKRLEIQPLGKFRAADEVVVAIGNPTPVVFRDPDFLDVGFHQGRVLPDHLHFLLFAGSHFGDDLVQRPGGRQGDCACAASGAEQNTTATTRNFKVRMALIPPKNTALSENFRGRKTRTDKTLE